MASPFRMFRRQEKKMLALLAILAMFAFTFLGVGTMSIPAVVEFLGFSAGSPGAQVVATTHWGNLTQNDVSHLLNRRHTANQFVFQAQFAALDAIQGRIAQSSQEAQSQLFSRYFALQQSASQSFFGPATEEDVIDAFVVRHKAEELGIQVSDKSISDFIKRVTQNGLSEEDFETICRNLGGGHRSISGKSLYDVLRDELMVSELLQVAGAGGGGVAGLSTPTPSQLWDEYQKLNTRVNLEVAAVRVDDFVDQVSPPSGDQARAYFAKYKDRLPDPNSPEPGFRQPHRVQVEYVMANYDALSANVEVSEEEVRSFYEENKEQLYRIIKPPAEEPKTGADAASPEDAGSQLPPFEAEPEDKADEDPAGANEAQEPGGAGSAVEQPASDDTGTDAQPESSGDDAKAQPNEPAAAADPQATGSAEIAPDEPAEDAAEPAAEVSSQPGAPPSEAPAVSDLTAPEDTSPQPEGPSSEATEDKPGEKTEEPQYRPLDDALALEIHDQLVRQKTREKIDRLLRQVEEDVMYAFQTKHAEWQSEKEENPKTAGPEPKRPDLKAAAEQQGLEYGQTPLVSQLEAEKLPALGQATASRGATADGESFAQQAFADRPRFTPLTVEEPNGNTFLYWKIADKAEHEPTFEEIEQQVVEAWRSEQARELAGKRADELADTARSAGKPLEEALSGVPEVVVANTGMFSWLSLPSALGTNPLIPGMPQQSTVRGVERAGEQFLQAALRLAEGEITVAPNQTLTVYYVLHCVRREPADRAKFAKETFFSGFAPTPYQRLAELRQQDVLQRWLKELQEEAGLQMHKPEKTQDAVEEPEST